MSFDNSSHGFVSVNYASPVMTLGTVHGDCKDNLPQKTWCHACTHSHTLSLTHCYANLIDTDVLIYYIYLWSTERDLII